MKYVSTRGAAPAVGFETALLSGLTPDGGLYAPVSWPELPNDVCNRGFASAAARIVELFAAPAFDRETLEEMTAAAYATFTNIDVAPLAQIGEQDYLLELFHGPTLAFKDIAMQLLARLFGRALARGGGSATIIGATSGDTGGAAIEAFRGEDRIEVFILHPEGRISEVQRLMMTTVSEPNIHNIAIAGAFDDCQRIVKALFADASFVRRVNLTAVNSINWARLAIQTVYYFTALAALKEKTGITKASFSIPTGNFGDAFAGFAAKNMGAKISALCIGVNQNDILDRALSTGRYQPTGVTPTTSPSMDIQVASNFERLLFEASGRDGGATAALMRDFEANGAIDIPDEWLATICKDFISFKVGEEEVAQTIADVDAALGMLIDPHTAVGVAAARKARAADRLSGPVITLATAHPAKFPDAVEAASGRRPPLPERLQHIHTLSERFETAPPDVAAVRDIILARRSTEAQTHG